MTDHIDIWVCTDCYFAHHYGATAMVRGDDGELWGPFSEEDRADMAGTEFVWFSGESDQPCEGGEPLALIDDKFDLADNTCSNHYYGQDVSRLDEFDHLPPCDCCGQSDWEDGITEFSWRSCQGCGSNLGGSRYRLALFVKEDA
jgi:hypothetical protein